MRIKLQLIACGFALVAQPVGAAIHCQSSFQRVGDLWISTPYCEDANLALVASASGQRTSAALIRQNYGAKRKACRLVGRDNRVTEACAGTWTRAQP